MTLDLGADARGVGPGQATSPMSYRIGLVCSAGGHLAQLFSLQPWWSAHDRFWVTFDKPDSRDLLATERVYHASGPTNRHYGNLARNFALAGEILAAEQPDVLVSNGAGLALPFFVRARWLAIPLVYVEVPDRLDAPSVTGRALYGIVDRMVLTHECQRRFYPRGILVEARP